MRGRTVADASLALMKIGSMAALESLGRMAGARSLPQTTLGGVLDVLMVASGGRREPDDPIKHRISVLSPEGCALIGLSESQSIRYAVEVGRARWLTVLQVLLQPEGRGLARK